MSQTQQQTAESSRIPTPGITAPASSASDSAFDEIRQHMVDDQVRPVEVSDPRIILAMRTLPRERAIPAAERDFAYADRTLPLGDGRWLMQPMTTARLVQSARIAAGERVLVVAAGTGYLASIVASLEAHVIALESDAELVRQGHAYTDQVTPGVIWRQGPLADGAPENAPFDVILFDGAIRNIPAFCIAQLAAGGRVAGMLNKAGICSAFIAEPDRTGQADSTTNTFEGWATRLSFDAPAPLIGELLPAPAFAF
ncbi:protein-L-isoaspartate O-methyltransferase [Acetobacter musti]|uniref:Protein-L-isoaspartate O-methyltransferase n=1 Tax=Acetobacter musti TaxID=864732 RepID=A0ABX0JTC4_9PROT|nr:protein-L-isoaspartate O-methyltransferase [Acetobacter musti]NHN85761.1 protein-L-isoaspartate O-methyltransferase [Acetobacter musti]